MDAGWVWKQTCSGRRILLVLLGRRSILFRFLRDIKLKEEALGATVQ